MDSLSESFAGLEAYIAVVLGLITVTILYYSWTLVEERVPGYEVPPPEQCRHDWQGTVLENPSLKVSTRSCSCDPYCVLTTSSCHRYLGHRQFNATAPQTASPWV